MSAFFAQITPSDVVRMYLACLFGTVLCYGFVIGLVNTVEFMTVVGGVVGWFARQMTTPTTPPPATTTPTPTP